MADLIRPWQEVHYMHFRRMLECTVTAIGKDAAGIHTLMVTIVMNNQRLPYKVITRTEDCPQGIPLGYVGVGHIIEFFYSSIDETARIPAMTPIEILNKTHKGGDIIHFKTGKVYDCAAKSKTFDPWQEYVKDMETLRKGEAES